MTTIERRRKLRISSLHLFFKKNMCSILRAGFFALLLCLPIVVFNMASPALEQVPESINKMAWVRNTGAGLYGQVNLQTLELTSKKSISTENPLYNSAVARLDTGNFLIYGENYLPINEISPADILADTIPIKNESSYFTDLAEQYVDGQKVTDRWNVIQMRDEGGGSEIMVIENGVETVLPDSNTAAGSAANRGVEVFAVADKIVVSANTTGEVWVGEISQEVTKWRVVASTLNNWVDDANRADSIESLVLPQSNVCPKQGVVKEFGVRPGQFNIVPVLVPILDANPHDVLSIVGSAQSSNSQFGDVQVVNSGKSLAVHIPSDAKSTSQTNVLINVTDGGSDNSGQCLVPISYTLRVHTYDEQNTPPIQVGAGVPVHQMKIGPYPTITSVDALSGWVDLDGDTFFAAVDPVPDLVAQDYNVVMNEDGKTSVQVKPNAVTKSNVNILYTVFDILGSEADTNLEFEYTQKPDLVLDNINLEGFLDSKTTVDMAKYLHFAPLEWVLEVENVSKLIEVEVSPDGQSLDITPLDVGFLSFNYNISGSNQVGVINIIVNEVLDISDVFAFNPFETTLANESDIVIDLKSLIINPHNLSNALVSTSVNSVYNSQDQMVADVRSDIIDNTSIHIDVSLLQKLESRITKSATIVLKFELDNSPPVLGYILVNITTRVTTTDYILLPDQVAVHADETIDVEVLRNDLVAIGNVLRLDPRDPPKITQSRSILFASSNLVRFYASKETKPGDKITQDYCTFIDGYMQSSRSCSTITFVIVGVDTHLDSSYSGTVLPSDQTKPHVDSDDSFASKPIGFRDVKYANQGSVVDINPLNNDYFPDGMIGKVTSKKLVNSDSNIADSETNLEMDKYAVRVNSDSTIWEVTVDVFSDGSNIFYGQVDSKITTYTEKIVIRVTNEEVLESFPVLKDTLIRPDEISKRQIWQTDVRKQFYSDSSTLNTEFSIFNIPSQSSTKSEDYEEIYNTTTQVGDFTFTGKMSDSAQIIPVAAKVSEKVSTYGFIRVPPLSKVVPIRVDNQTKTIQVPLTLTIVLGDEITPLEDVQLIAVQDSVKTSGQRPQANIEYRDMKLLYSPGENSNDTENDILTSDVISVDVMWENEPDSTTTIRFTVQVIPKVTLPKIRDGVNLVELAPKEHSMITLSDYITWSGHTSNEIMNVKIRCDLGEDFIIECEDGILRLEVKRNAKEQTVHTINLQIEGYNSMPVHWTIKVKSTPKQSDIILETPDILTLTKTANSANFDALTPVKKLFEKAEYYGFLGGGRN